MKKWKVSYTNRVEQQLRKIPIEIKKLVGKAIINFEEYGPFPENWDIKKLSKSKYRMRLNYRYRMLYELKNETLIIKVIYIGHRKNAYK